MLYLSECVHRTSFLTDGGNIILPPIASFAATI
jgi:hypothetical protein